MTDSEHAALSAQLARALGAEGNRVPNGVAWVLDPPLPLGKRTLFDYRSPDVYLPLIEWLLRYHEAMFYYQRGRIWLDVLGQDCQKADTLPEAVARAVIAVKEKT